MKSPMVESADYIKDKDRYSELRVMQSNAGWYIGTIYNGEDGIEPGSRDSEYFATEQAAQQWLDELERGEPKELRMRP